MNALHYSSAALMRRCGGILLMTTLVAGDYLFDIRRSVHFLQIAPVLAPVIAAVTLYLIGATMVMILSLARHGAVAVAFDEAGVDYHTAWTRRRFAWDDLSTIALDVRHTRNAHHFVVVLRRAQAVRDAFSIDLRLLAETLDQAGDWVDAAECERLAKGGAAYAAPTGLLTGWGVRERAQEVAAARAAGRG